MQEEDGNMRNSNCELVFGDRAGVEGFLSNILKNPDEQGVVISRLTLKDKFILRVVFRDNRKRTVSDSFLLHAVLLIKEMLIWPKNDFLIT